jgi:hypothetical protein
MPPPGSVTTMGTCQLRATNPTGPGRMPALVADEVIRTTTAPPPRPAALPSADSGVQLAAMTDGRKRALSALAYHVGGLLEWSGGDNNRVTDQLVEVGVIRGLTQGIAQRIVTRAVANGTKKPIRP